ncbi:energy transducer TonB [Tenacibaculum agarivorans]|uniref:energy transducer TonB n=1 Tax=Tenacibaculum agarivorans TaxID=1908389 RepID=UPI00094BA54E|nr:energy transducer TonB [Tenacibaculum agarivorans]
MKNLLLIIAIIFSLQGIAQNRDKELEEIGFSIIDEPPVFPGCETLGSKAEQKNCFNMKMRKHVQKTFNLGDVNCIDKKKVFNKELNITEEKCIGLEKGIQRVYILFKIGKEGDIEDIKVNAPHPKLQQEAYRIAKLLPKMKPGLSEGEPVRVSYALPITFRVE